LLTTIFSLAIVIVVFACKAKRHGPYRVAKK